MVIAIDWGNRPVLSIKSTALSILESRYETNGSPYVRQFFTAIFLATVGNNLSTVLTLKRANELLLFNRLARSNDAFNARRVIWRPVILFGSSPYPSSLGSSSAMDGR